MTGDTLKQLQVF